MQTDQMRKLTVALFGNPNVGKSTLFNALTGMRQHTGNWPGKTVEVAQGTMYKDDVCYTFVDLPGTYSLQGKSDDEIVAGEYLADGQSDCTVVVCDANCLERSLILALQVLMRTERVVVCINMVDEAMRHGIAIDQKRLSGYLQASVVLTAAGKNVGLETLVETIRNTAFGASNLCRRDWEDPITAAEQIAKDCIQIDDKKKPNYRFQVERLLVSRRFGVMLMFLIMLALIWITVYGANYPSALIMRIFEIGYQFLLRILSDAPNWLRGILADGLYSTCARVISVMLPPMMIFFLLFTFLEDIGYLPRMAFLLDPCMARCGGCGKQALTLCMGLGCNAVGVMGCRIIESPRERLRAILTNAMIPCNGRFPTLILLGTIFFPEAGAALMVALCVALGAVGAMAVSGVLSRCSASGTFVMEMPPFRRPRLSKLLSRCMIERTLFVVLRAVYVAAPAGVVLWIAANTSVLSQLASFLEPIGKLMGMNGTLLLAFFLALPANELFIPIVIMILSGAGNLQQTSGINTQILADGFLTWQMALCTMVFTLFHWPCSTTILTIFRETRSIKKTAAACILPTAVGVVLCIILRLILV